MRVDDLEGANEPGCASGEIAGEDVVVSHVYCVDEGVRGVDRWKASLSHPFVLPGRPSIFGEGTKPIDQEVRRVVASVVETDPNGAGFVHGHRWLVLICSATILQRFGVRIHPDSSRPCDSAISRPPENGRGTDRSEEHTSE